MYTLIGLKALKVTVNNNELVIGEPQKSIEAIKFLAAAIKSLFPYAGYFYAMVLPMAYPHRYEFGEGESIAISYLGPIKDVLNVLFRTSLMGVDQAKLAIVKLFTDRYLSPTSLEQLVFIKKVLSLPVKSGKPLRLKLKLKECHASLFFTAKILLCSGKSDSQVLTEQVERFWLGRDERSTKGFYELLRAIDEKSDSKPLMVWVRLWLSLDHPELIMAMALPDMLRGFFAPFLELSGKKGKRRKMTESAKLSQSSAPRYAHYMALLSSLGQDDSPAGVKKAVENAQLNGFYPGVIPLLDAFQLFPQRLNGFIAEFHDVPKELIFWHGRSLMLQMLIEAPGQAGYESLQSLMQSNQLVGHDIQELMKLAGYSMQSFASSSIEDKPPKLKRQKPPNIRSNHLYSEELYKKVQKLRDIQLKNKALDNKLAPARLPYGERLLSDMKEDITVTDILNRLALLDKGSPEFLEKSKHLYLLHLLKKLNVRVASGIHIPKISHRELNHSIQLWVPPLLMSNPYASLVYGLLQLQSWEEQQAHEVFMFSLNDLIVGSLGGLTQATATLVAFLSRPENRDFQGQGLVALLIRLNDLQEEDEHQVSIILDSEGVAKEEEDNIASWKSWLAPGVSKEQRIAAVTTLAIDEGRRQWLKIMLALVYSDPTIYDEGDQSLSLDAWHNMALLLGTAQLSDGYERFEQAEDSFMGLLKSVLLGSDTIQGIMPSLEQKIIALARQQEKRMSYFFYQAPLILFTEKVFSRIGHRSQLDDQAIGLIAGLTLIHLVIKANDPNTEAEGKERLIELFTKILKVNHFFHPKSLFTVFYNVLSNRFGMPDKVKRVVKQRGK